MPEFINGLPLHALVVHAVVVLIPLAVLGAVVIAVWQAARARYGWLVVAFAVVGTVLTPIATSSGDDLSRRLPENPLIERHEELGDLLIWFVLGLLVAVTALMVVTTRRPETWTKPVVIVLAVLTVGTGVAAGVHTFRVGEAGATAVWQGTDQQPVRGR
ncbi:hypothetical protein V5P93_003376 [Actinokineospora auranticolor]|uniref:DUF2231 domain-containing protein n=1 Tax=Actinokineospora auranticolor TaxID=155976 RepID=A0A2S6GPB9_9PSEU|nr:DUF2231 domain-containing protein [Actinokineospora auranticolor]PPK67036.1 hypothetical protein CLV40_10833 [Actinokineospora auranticolor]